MESEHKPNEHKDDEFSREADKEQSGLVGEMIAFLRQNRKWWLVPIVVVMALLGLFVVLAGTGAAPFIYTLF
ncbi:MAG: hypothetical protein HY698_21310 [Deltaproteobacteria bacterium]|nr:hypothetical protein [Deltaproteobacteria bacterium]